MDQTQNQIEENERINIEQEDDWVECMTCGIFAKENVYHIYTHPILSEQEEVVTIREHSPYFQRLC